MTKPVAVHFAVSERSVPYGPLVCACTGNIGSELHVMTQNPVTVTCGNCKRTRAWIEASRIGRPTREPSEEVIRQEVSLRNISGVPVRAPFPRRGRISVIIRRGYEIGAGRAVWVVMGENLP